MTDTTTQVQVETTVTALVATPKSVAARLARKRFSFGPTWNTAVVAGTATDQAKLLAQAMKLKVGAPSDLKKLKLETLRAKVAAKLEADVLAAFDGATADTTTEADEAAPVATTEAAAV